MRYGYKKEVESDFNTAVSKIKEKLSNEGFGILTEIDVKDTLKKKLNVDYENYLILGACNPPFAYDALKNEKDIGLLLPCNVIIYSQNDKTFISAINPLTAMSIVDNPSLSKTAEEVGLKLRNVINSI